MLMAQIIGVPYLCYVAKSGWTSNLKNNFKDFLFVSNWKKSQYQLMGNLLKHMLHLSEHFKYSSSLHMEIISWSLNTDQAISYYNDLQGQINESFAFGSVNYYCSNTILQKLYSGVFRVCKLESVWLRLCYHSIQPLTSGKVYPWFAAAFLTYTTYKLLFLNTGSNITNKCHWQI